jgi:uncharacterized damage-inducible protein DinB
MSESSQPENTASKSSDLRYPIGRFALPETIAPDDIDRWLEQMAALPAHLHDAVRNLTDAQLDSRYRPAGWTLRQVVHHLADSHVNSFIRIKLALTEDKPVIKPYDENRWAELPDSRGDIEPSLDMIAALHARGLPLLEHLTASDWQRTFWHPEQKKAVTLEHTLAYYAWHGLHHTAHITHTRQQHGW